MLVPQPELSAVRAPDAARIGRRAIPYALEYHGVVAHRHRFDRARRRPIACRAILIVSPNNPDRLVPASRRSRRRCRDLAAARGWAIIGDEVFADYPLDPAPDATHVLAGADVLTFSLGGLSKSAGLPQLKLGWIGVRRTDREGGRSAGGLRNRCRHLSVGVDAGAGRGRGADRARRRDSRADPGAGRGAISSRCATLAAAHPSVERAARRRRLVGRAPGARSFAREEALVARAARQGRCARASGLLLRFRARSVRRRQPARRAGDVRSRRSRACWRAPPEPQS